MLGRIPAAIMLPAAVFVVAAKKPEVPIDPGPPPASLERFQELAVPAVLAGFFDPGSAQFQWDRDVIGGYWKPVLGKKVPGWWTCGLVNGKNRMGGYVGFRRFVVVVNYDRVAFVQTGDGSTYDFTVTVRRCHSEGYSSDRRFETRGAADSCRRTPLWV